MSMRVHDLQKWGQVHFSAQASGWLHRGRFYGKNVPVPAYRHKRASGPDPVNIVLFASIFILSGFLLYSIVNTIRYVPALETQRGLTMAEGNLSGVAPFVGNVEHAQQGLTPAQAHPIGGLTPSTGTQSKPWYEKPPYVREGLLSERIAGYRAMKGDMQKENIQAGILK